MLSPPIVIIFSNNMINGSDWFVRDGPPVMTLLYFFHPKTIKYWSQHRSMLESLYHCGCITFSLSWRVQVDSADYQKALLPSSGKSGWAVKPYFFRRIRVDNQQDRNSGLAQFLAQHGQMGHLGQNIHP